MLTIPRSVILKKPNNEAVGNSTSCKQYSPPNGTVEISFSIFAMDEKHKQHLLSGANQMRQLVNDSVNVDGLSEKEAEDARKAKRDEVYHKIGIAYFVDMREKILLTLEAFSKNHLHIVQTGELETILIPYGVPHQNKKKWITTAINKIEALDPSDIPSNSVLYKMLSQVVQN